MANEKRLIALIQSAVDGCATYWAGLIADHLIANGVTFAKDKNVLTNGDRIRAMTDEELADFIRDVSHECQEAYSGSCMRCKYPWCVCADTEKWLKQPAEVE